jgi:RHS repeat-associated protein
MLSEASAASGSGSGGYNTFYNHSGASGYGYDTAYNPTLYSYWNGGTDTTLSLPANADNQINLGGFAWDGDGNPSTYKSAVFSFDPEDRLTAISSPAFVATYDGDGLRVTKTAAGVTTYFVYDGSSPIAEETFNGTSATFTALNGVTADGWRARKQGSIVHQYVYDPQGSVQERHTEAAYSSGLAAYDRSTFEGYGALRGAYKGSTGAGTGQHDPAGFGGQFGYYTDIETGLLCLTHRYYDPGTGKFLTRDPIGYGGGMNLYGFAGGNPVNESDPSGYDSLLSWSDFKQGIGTGWAGFSTSVWNTPGLSNLNRKYGIYSAGDYANQPGFDTSVTLGAIGLAVLPIPGVAKLTLFAKAANAARLTRAAYLAETGNRLRRVIPTSFGLVQATAQVASKGNTLILDGITIGLQNGKEIPKGLVTREMLILTRSVMNDAKQAGFKYLRVKAFRMPGQTANPFRDVDKLIKLK